MEKRIRKRSTRATRRERERQAVKQKIDRDEIFIRDKWRCHICKQQVRDIPNHPREATLDHVIPLSKGGSHTYKNLKTCCRKCNSDKGNTVK